MPPLNLIIPLLGTVIDRIFPDEQKAAEAKLELATMQQKGELQLLASQLEVNKAEASTGNMFIGGWRPFIGWVCGSALAYEYLLLPLLSWIALIVNVPQPPHLMMDGMMELVIAMLGIAGLRSLDKYNGVAK
jgi:hypothetical protein